METYVEYMKRHDEEWRQINVEFNNLLTAYSIEELETRFFKDFGCINFIDEKTNHELKLAKAFHKFHMIRFPDDHEKHESEPYHCYHVTSCKCGLSTAVDSGD